VPSFSEVVARQPPDDPRTDIEFYRDHRDDYRYTHRSFVRVFWWLYRKPQPRHNATYTANKGDQ
jgi:hypothetical protein